MFFLFRSGMYSYMLNTSSTVIGKLTPINHTVEINLVETKSVFKVITAHRYPQIIFQLSTYLVYNIQYLKSFCSKGL